MKWIEMQLFLSNTLNISLKHFADTQFYNSLIIPSFPPSHFPRTGQMTSVENIDLNGDACSSLSKSAGSPSVEENNMLFCCLLWKCHYTSCLRPDAHRSHSTGCWNSQKHTSALTHKMTRSCIVGWFLIKCYADIPTIYSKWSHNDKKKNYVTIQ